MSSSAQLWLARHGETEWTISRQHTGATDLPLTENGETQARALASRLAGHDFAIVLSSPLARARVTAELAGVGDQLEIDDDLLEWDYGEYEGITTAQILEREPDWDLWRDGCPGGETAAEVGARVDRVLQRVAGADGDALVVGHAHCSRVLGARALGLEPQAGKLMMMGTATLSVVGVEHGHPAIVRWNDDCHIGGG